MLTLPAIRHSLDNVTFRRRGPSDPEKQSQNISYAEDLIYLDHIRDIVREEFQYALREQLAGVIANTISEQISAVLGDSVTQLNKRMEMLEKRLDDLESAHLNCNKTTKESSQTGISEKSMTNGKTETPLVSTNLTQPGKTQGRQNEIMTKISSSQKSTVTDFKFNNDRRDEWVEVAKPRRRSNQPILLRGTAAPGKTKLEASERLRSFHLFYVKSGTTCDLIREHVEAITGDSRCKVEPLKARGQYASFKLTLSSKLSEQILAAEHWPEDVCIKPWRQPFRKRDEGASSKQ